MPAPAEVFFLVSVVAQAAYIFSKTDLGSWSLLCPLLQFMLFGPILLLEMFIDQEKKVKVTKVVTFLTSFLPVLIVEVLR
jgi:hypothetical protein